ncbi:MAG: hypothetical protein JWR80_4751 [Bradyrhizobium sp.]|nr:hypothetical protein [Bradyrhizobium sp.]
MDPLDQPVCGNRNFQSADLVAKIAREIESHHCMSIVIYVEGQKFACRAVPDRELIEVAANAVNADECIAHRDIVDNGIIRKRVRAASMSNALVVWIKVSISFCIPLASIQ